MPVRMTGMISGMDTESLIKGMVDAQKLKNKRTTDKSVLLEWKQEKWKELNTKLYKLYQEDLSKLRLQGNYQTKKVTSSNENIVSVTGNTTAPEGSHTITNIQLASGQYVTGKEFKSLGADGKAITGNSKLIDALGMTDKTLINIEVNGNKATLDVNSDTTINSFLQVLKDAGLNASYDTTQKRFFISSKNSGEDNKFTITTSTETGTADKRVINSAIGYSSLTSADKAKVESAYNVIKGADESKLSAALENTNVLETDDEEMKALKNAVATLNSLTDTKLTTQYTNDAKNIATSRAKDDMKSAIINGGSYAEVDYVGVYDTFIHTAEEELKRKYNDENLDFSNEKYKTERDDLVSSYVDARVASSMNTEQVKSIIGNEEKNIIDNGTTVITTNEDGSITETIIDSLENARVKTLEDLEINIKAYSKSEPNGIIGELSKLGLTELSEDTDGKIITADSNVKLIHASDSQITYNGAVLTGTSNVITANGLTFNLKGETSETINLSVINNKQETYDMIKKFITSYNDILKEMNQLYYAGSSKGYDPLSDEDKEAMTDKQIEKWEDKIKDSILRRDSSLGSVLSVMKISVMSQIEVNGKNYSLASFGIGTSSDYTEKGLLHIDGDSSDALVSTMADKLMKALEEDPDTVSAVISGVAKKLYDAVGEKMKAIPNVRSAFTFYNDKLMANQQTEYKKKIKILESKLIEVENKYYKQFAAMESALSKLQSQTNALSGMLGKNN